MVRIIPLIILGFLTAVSWGISIAKHGEEHPDYNGWTSLIAWILQWGLILWAIF